MRHDELPRGVQQFRMLELALFDPAMSLGDSRILYVLVRMHNWRDGYSHPDLTTLAAEARLSRSACAESLGRLRRAGYVRVVLKGAGHRANRYTPAFEMIDADRSSAADSTATGSASSPVGRTAGATCSSPVERTTAAPLSSPVEGASNPVSDPLAVRFRARSSPLERTLTHEPIEPTDYTPALQAGVCSPTEPGAASPSSSASPSSPRQEDDARQAAAQIKLRTLFAKATGLMKARLRAAVDTDAVDAVARGEHVLLNDAQIAAIEALLEIEVPGAANP